MEAIFTYGAKKTALTPRTILYGATPVFLGSRTYSPTDSYDSIAVVGSLPLSPEATAAMADVQSLQSVAALNARIAAIDTAIANLTLFEKDTRAYYDMRVDRTSGGKRQRLRDERAALCDQANNEAATLRSARASAVRLATAMATAKQDDFNPQTGVALTETEKAAAAQSAAAGSAGMKSLILPIGAALAALFVLKGH